ncbi:MAG: hypothetical protein AABY07_02000 [Nanoarchaeota archaeon]
MTRFYGVLILFVALFVITSVTAAHENVNYDYLIGNEFLEEFGPVMAKARNGDTIEFKGGGTFSTKPKTATGTGTFIHRNADGDIIGAGVWTATDLITFKSYGSGSFQELPAEFEGGRALIRVYLDPDPRIPGFNGVLKVTCLLGNKIPPKAQEGVQLLVRDAKINFNREMGGATLFIREE